MVDGDVVAIFVLLLSFAGDDIIYLRFQWNDFAFEIENLPLLMNFMFNSRRYRRFFLLVQVIADKMILFIVLLK